MKSSTVEIKVEVKAILVRAGAKEKAVWLPLSQVEIEPNGAFEGIETVTLPEWLAIEKGLI